MSAKPLVADVKQLLSIPRESKRVRIEELHGRDGQCWRYVVVTSMDMQQAEQLLDWLENQGHTRCEISCPDGKRMTVRVLLPQEPPPELELRYQNRSSA